MKKEKLLDLKDDILICLENILWFFLVIIQCFVIAVIILTITILSVSFVVWVSEVLLGVV